MKWENPIAARNRGTANAPAQKTASAPPATPAGAACPCTTPIWLEIILLTDRMPDTVVLRGTASKDLKNDISRDLAWWRRILPQQGGDIRDRDMPLSEAIENSIDLSSDSNYVGSFVDQLAMGGCGAQ
ncbi:hypothetical protein ACWGJX_48060 [Streptomyces sp. NPDC054775]